MTNQPIRLSAAQKTSVTCPVCGYGPGQSCRTAKGSVSKEHQTISSRTHSERVALAKTKVVAMVAEAVKVTWMFNWTVGGYNTVRAASMAEALVLAKALGQGWNSGGVVEGSLKVVTADEVAKVDAAWAPFFD
jgi:hypothetical protein